MVGGYVYGHLYSTQTEKEFVFLLNQHEITTMNVWPSHKPEQLQYIHTES